MGAGVSRTVLAAGDRDRAMEYFESALKLEGGTEKARQEARQGLELTRKELN